MTEPAPRLATLPLDQIIQVYPGFWFCALCSHPGRPGLGRHWAPEAVAIAHTAAIEHLRERHGLREIRDQ